MGSSLGLQQVISPFGELGELGAKLMFMLKVHEILASGTVQGPVVVFSALRFSISCFVPKILAVN